MSFLVGLIGWWLGSITAGTLAATLLTGIGWNPDSVEYGMTMFGVFVAGGIAGAITLTRLRRNRLARNTN